MGKLRPHRHRGPSDEPVLAPLGQYGGPTETIALLPGSPALGKGIAVSGVTTDQRGWAEDSPITSAPSSFIPATRWS